MQEKGATVCSGELLKSFKRKKHLHWFLKVDLGCNRVCEFEEPFMRGTYPARGRRGNGKFVGAGVYCRDVDLW